MVRRMAQCEQQDFFSCPKICDGSRTVGSRVTQREMEEERNIPQERQQD